MKKISLWVIFLMAVFTMGSFCACGDDDDDNGGGSSGGVGSGYAEMDEHKSSFKYAYYGHEQGDSEYMIFFMGRPWMDMLNDPKQTDASFLLTFNSNVNPDLKNMDLNSIIEGTISKGVGLEYTPYNASTDEDYVEPVYISGMLSNRENTTVTVTKTGTNRYRIVAKNQTYYVQENGHGIGGSGVRTVVGNFEWEGPIVDVKSVIPAEYWQE